MYKIIYFSAPWCGPCRVFGPLMDKVVPLFKTDYQKINVDDNTNAILEYSIFGIPTVIMEKDGKEVKRFSGAINETDLKDWIAGAI